MNYGAAPSTKKDQTLYLSNSTFYNDTQESKPESWSNTDINVVRQCRTQDCKFFGSAENQFYCSQCWSDVGAETKFKLPYDNKFCQTKNK
ncbi:uncharacterized protein LOC106636947 isoform X2 [Copidosoma floridanum]|uniref:uncharacterized protein LOC106636947 isoform X2 n=1 Tax=Copidosoma floridanum TaxID=29053 RepID=UPI0006C97312|nr:uncharacterized protein LOC106636947 isoform X2 [Copidosoma floridanum]